MLLISSQSFCLYCVLPEEEEEEADLPKHVVMKTTKSVL
jgi:hypothetical protein